MPSTDRAAVDLYREWQRALRDFGDTHVADELLRELTRLIGINPWIDNEGFETQLIRLHLAAFPCATTRPPLVARTRSTSLRTAELRATRTRLGC
jgi:hypothetical protein